MSNAAKKFNVIGTVQRLMAATSAAAVMAGTAGCAAPQSIAVGGKVGGTNTTVIANPGGTAVRTNGKDGGVGVEVRQNGFCVDTRVIGGNGRICY